MPDIVKRNSNLLPISIKEVEDKITLIRGKEVIADADIAVLYGVETKRVNEAVRNNPDKFPDKYMFELTKGELQNLRSKISSTNVSGDRINFGDKLLHRQTEAHSKTSA